MDDDFRIIVSSKCRVEGSKEATGLHDLFRKEIEELGSSDPKWYTNGLCEVSSVDYKEIPGRPESRGSTTDEDGISSSVRNLIKLLVNRASTHSFNGTPCPKEDGLESFNDEDETIGADESWTSSMATPSKNCLSFSEVNHSSVLNVNHDNSSLQHDNTNFESDLLLEKLSCIEEGRESPKTGYVFYGFEDPVVDVRIKSVQGQSVYSIDGISLFNNYVDAVESNFIIPPVTVSADTRQDNFSVKTSAADPSENLCFVSPIVLVNANNDKTPEVTTTEVVSDINVDFSSSSHCSFSEHTFGNRYLNVAKSNEVVNAGQLSLDCEKTVNGQACMQTSSNLSERVLQQTELSELKSLTENDRVTDEPKIIGTSSAVNSYSVGPTEVHHCSFEIDLSVNKMTDAKEIHNVVMDNNSFHANRHSDEISDTVCSPGKNTTSFPDGGLGKSNSDLDVARNSIEEPEYVTQILNLLCSPINLSECNTRMRKRKIDAAEAEVVKRTCCEKESYCVVQEVMEELWEKVQYRLEEVKIIAPTSGHIVTNVDENVQVYTFKDNVNDLQDAKCENILHPEGNNHHKGIKLEENTLASWDDVHNAGLNLNKRSISQELMSSSFREQNISTVTSNEGMSNAAGSSTPKHEGSGTDVALSKDGQSSPENDRVALRSSCSKWEMAPSDPQLTIGRNAEVKVDSENEKESYLNLSLTRDFLSCSVLEEVCQASEALAYIGKMKNDCLIDQDNKNDFKSTRESYNLFGDKMEIGSVCVATRDEITKRHLNHKDEAIEVSANYCTNGPSVSGNSMPPSGKEEYSHITECKKVTPGGKRYQSCQGDKNSFSKSIKKKIVFTIPGYCEVNEFENEFYIEDGEYPEVLNDSSEKCSKLSLPSSSNDNCSNSEREKCEASTGHQGSWHFVYPKKRIQRDSLVIKGVSPEDLMSRAAELEKYSTLDTNHDKSNLTGLNTSSLVSFSSLEPIKGYHLTSLKNKINGGEKTKETITLRILPNLEQYKPFEDFRHYEMPGEAKDPIIAMDNAESGTLVKQLDGTKILEKQAVIQKVNCCDMATEPQLAEVIQVRKPLINECTLKMEVQGSEQNEEGNERESVCTSPILTKFRIKKSFIRRSKNKTNTCSPMVKKKLASSKNKPSSKTVDVGAEEYNPQLIKDFYLQDSLHKSGKSNINYSTDDQENKDNTEKSHIKQQEVFNQNSSPHKSDDGALTTLNDKKIFSSKKYANKANKLYHEQGKSLEGGDVIGVSKGTCKKVLVTENKNERKNKLFVEKLATLAKDDINTTNVNGKNEGPPSKFLSKKRMLSSGASTPVRSEMAGFSSASGKKVTASEKSLAHARKFNAEASAPSGGDNLGIAKIGEENEDDNLKSLVKTKMLSCEGSTPVRSEFAGFSSASGKKVTVSEKSLAYARKLYAEASAPSGGDDLGIVKVGGENEDASLKSLVKTKMLSCEASTPVRSEFAGFSSASGKKVTVSEKSLAYARKLYAEASAPSGGDDLGIVKVGGENEDASLKSLVKTKMLSCEASTPVRSEFAGFSSASGKKVTVSEKSLAYARKLYAEASAPSGGDDLGIVKVGGENEDASLKSLVKTKMLSCEASTPVRSEFAGFSSASGKKVTVSEKSLAYARKLYAEASAPSGGDDLGIVKVGGENEDASLKSLVKTKMLSCEASTPVRSEFAGFSSASGKKVTVSEKSLAYARKLYAEASAPSGGDDLGIVKVGGENEDASLKSLVKTKMLSCEASTPVRLEFAGFSSASGKKVTVSEKSLAYARKLYAEASAPSGGDDLGIVKVGGENEDASLKSLVKTKMLSCEGSTPVRSEFAGFSSASGKKVTVSEKSLAYARKLYAEASAPSGGDDLGIVKVGGENEDASLKSLVKTKMLSCEASTPVRSEFAGFSSASGKKVTVSEKSLAYARKLYAEASAPSGGDDLGIVKVGGENEDASLKSLVKTKMLSCEGSTPVRSEFAGFSSASGKKVTVSEKSLAYSRKLYAEASAPSGGDDLGIVKVGGENEDASLKSLVKTKMLSCEASTPVRSEFAGFSSASGKKVTVSEKSLAYARKLYAEASAPSGGDDLGIVKVGGENEDASLKSLVKTKMLSCEASTPVRSEFAGFSSASGKKVTVSEKSLAYARKLYAEASAPSGGDDLGIVKVGGENEDASLKSLVKTKMLSCEASTPVRSEFAGFSSASGKKVTVSEKSLAYARKLYAEASAPSGGDDLGIVKVGGENEDASLKSLVKTKMLSCEASTPVRSEFAGFSSASGKKVTVSEKSLAYARKLYAEASAPSGGDDLGIVKVGGENEDASLKSLVKTKMLSCEGSTPVRSEFAGFSSASGKKVTVSEKSLAYSRKLYAEASAPSGGDDLGIVKVGGENEDASLKSLVKTKMLSCEASTPVRSEFAGFSSASGKKVTVSEKSLAYARKLYAEASAPSGGDDLGIVKVGGENEDASLKSLVKTKMLSCEGSTPVRSEFAGFSSASGKKVTVSEKSLAYARNLYSEASAPSGGDDLGIAKVGGENEDASLKSLVKTKMLSCEGSTPVRSEFAGFCSASGKKVTVSEKSLAHARNLYAEATVSSEVDDLGLSEIGRENEDSSLNHLVKTKMPSCEPSTPDSSEFVRFSSASGKKISLPEKLMAHARELYAESSISSADNDFGHSIGNGKNVESPVKDLVKTCFLSAEVSTSLRNVSFDNVDTKSMHAKTDSHKYAQEENQVFNCFLQKPNEVKVPVDCKDRESSILYNKFPHSFLDDCHISHHCIASTVEPLKYVESPANSSHIIRNKHCDNSPSCVSICKFGSSLCIPDERNIAIDNAHLCDNFSDQVVTTNQDVFFSESQGDDYIKAVDVAVIDSPNTTLLDQNPPSPVFKTMKKSRLKAKRGSMRRKGIRPQTLLKSSCKATISGVDDGHNDESDSVTSSQSLVISLDQECADKEKYSDLWGGDVPDESWLGKQLELAEESSLEAKCSEDTDYWAKGRKIQEEIISSKGNVKPVIGHYSKVKRGMSQQCISLRDFVKGKRPGHYTKDELKRFGIQGETLNVTCKNAADFKFKLQEYYTELPRGDGVLVKDGFRLIPDKSGMFGVTEAQSSLLAGPGVDPKLLPTGGWCHNHYRWIIWKLASYEKSFPQEFGGRCLTPENVMCQLKYRWDREIDRGERSAICKILEKDDTASKRMTLCVSDIKKPALPSSCTKLELDLIANSSLLELTDGWYGINGIVDSELAHLLQRGSLTIGTKIVTSGAELINGPPNGCSPLEPAASAARIRLSANSTRRAGWDAKLGYVCSHPGPLPVSLHSLLPDGGAIGMLRNVLLARIYPILTIEKISDGRKVFRSKRAEARAAAKHEFERQTWLESVYAEVSAEMQRELEEETRRKKGKRGPPDCGGSGRSFKFPRRDHSTCIASGKSSLSSSHEETVPVEELSRLVDESGDPSEMQKLLTTSQVDMISAYRQEFRENFQKELEERVKQKIKQEEEKFMSSDRSQDPISAGRKNRDVVTLLKVRLVDADQPVIAKSAVFTIWRPSEDVISLLAKEGTILSIYGLTANGVRSNFIQLSSGKQTRYKLKKSKAFTAHLLKPTLSSLRRQILSRGFDDYKFNLGPGCNSSLPPFGEIDLVAMVIRVGEEPDRAKGQGFQHVYVAGSDGSLLSIAFWGGIQEFAVHEFLCPGSIVVILNLQWRRLHGLHRIATAQAVETSIFTLHPVEERLKAVLNNFMIEVEAEKQLQSTGTEFVHSCEQKLDAVLGIECKEVSEVRSCLKEGTSKGLKLVLSPSSVPGPVENIGILRPSVADRMKKLQIYAGFPEISLPPCHIRKSASVIKAFHPPKKCSETSTSSSHDSNLGEIVPKSCQSPQSFCSEIKTVNASLPESTNSKFTDADSPPMSLDSDPQE